MRLLSRRLHAGLALLFVVCLSACGTGSPLPETRNQGAALFELALQGSILAVEAQVDAGKIKGDRAREALRLVRVARAAVAAARIAIDGKRPDAAQLTDAAQRAIAAVLAFLEPKKETTNGPPRASGIPGFAGPPVWD